MPLVVYNTKNRSKEEFKPQNPPQVKMYVCGITAYDFCHLGHGRAAVVFDVVYRYLQHKGFEVNYVRNFTDIDDKIINRANETDEDWKELASKFMLAYEEDMKALGNHAPSQEPRATDHIQEMHEMIQKLIDQGLAYVASGDVYFSVRKFPSYGELANKHIDELASGARIEVQEAKQDPLDFALWKAAKPGEPQWDSPWGPGRPGWHIECSAMSTKYLGASLDIHGGGRDLSFPHHENERAQSEGALKKTFAKYWLHNGFVNLNADKMSKSTGNFLTIREVLKKYPTDAIRYFLLSSHYRSPLDFSDTAMQESLVAVERVYQTLQRLDEYSETEISASGTSDGSELEKKLEKFKDSFEAALDDDFNTALSLAHCFDLVREINKFLDKAPKPSEVLKLNTKINQSFELVGNCLGVFSKEPQLFLNERKGKALEHGRLSPAEIEAKIQSRKDARVKKDFALADQIRGELDQAGVILKDNPDGSTTWSVK